MVKLITVLVENADGDRVRSNADPVSLAEWRARGYEKIVSAPHAGSQVVASVTSEDLARDAERFAEKDAAEAEADSADEPAKKGRGRGRKGAA